MVKLPILILVLCNLSHCSNTVRPFNTAVSSCRYAITLTDYYFKWPELAFSHSATTEDVAHFLTSIFSRHGNPENIVTDNGPQFTSAVFASFLHDRQEKTVSKTSVYYPVANGAIPSCPQTLHSNCHPTVNTMERECDELASSLPCNTACNNIHLTIWTPLW